MAPYFEKKNKAAWLPSFNEFDETLRIFLAVWSTNRSHSAYLREISPYLTRRNKMGACADCWVEAPQWRRVWYVTMLLAPLLVIPGVACLLVGTCGFLEPLE